MGLFGIEPEKRHVEYATPTCRPAEWCVAENTHGFNYDARGVGWGNGGCRRQRTPRASGALAYHVTEAMQAMLTSAREAQFVEVASTCARPQPLPENFPEYC